MTNSPCHAVAADIVFDGTSVLPDTAVIIEGSQIRAVLPRDEVPTSLPIYCLPSEAWLAPGFIDVQVNGGGDVLFNDQPTPDGLRCIAAAHRKGGTTAFLPTLISDTSDKMQAALHAVQNISAENPSVVGIHFEGPYLSPDKPGAHDPSQLRVPGENDLRLLTSWPMGIVLVTLAPEQVPEGFISALVKAGVHVSLGHSMATYAETKAALSQGLSGFTHLFNAMRPLTAREPGPVPAALETATASFGIIVDGQHVEPSMLRIALRGVARPMLVTDAMPPVGGRKSSFVLGGQEICCRDGRCTRADGTLAGGGIDMATAVRNCVQILELPLATALQLASIRPAQFLGLAGKLGRLAPNYRADMVSLDPGPVRVFETWVAGAIGSRNWS